VIAPQLIEALNREVIPLFCEVDGNFPNHHPDPGKPENLEDLIAKVKETGADIGLAFDGDGDRVGVVTNRQHRLPRPPADAVRPRRAVAQPGRRDHLRRQMHPPPDR
jgi:phosphomannomutase